MPNNKIKCPKCNFEISIDEVLSHQLQEELRLEFEEKQKIKETELLKKEEEIANQKKQLDAAKDELSKKVDEEVESRLKTEKSEIEKKIKEDVSKENIQELTALKTSLKEKEDNLDKLRKEQADVLIEKQKLDEEKKSFELNILKEKESLTKQFEEKLKLEKTNIEETVKKEAAEKLEKEYSEKLENIKADGEERDKQNKDLRDQISDLMKQLREMKAKDEQRDIEYQKKIMEEESSIKDKAKQEAMEESRLQIAQREKQLDDLKKQLAEAQRKAEQGSQQTQGEVLELELEELLKQQFIYDEIIPVPKGDNGADVIQKVKNSFGKVCGTIVWESKRTKNWTESWIPKLKDDLRREKGDIAVIVSTALPDEIKNFGIREGVMVASFNSVIPLTTILRKQLIDLYNAKSSSEGKGKKSEIVYNYLISNDFKQRIEVWLEYFTSRQKEINVEKAYFTKKWEKEEKSIQKIYMNTSGIYGDLQGLIGTALPKIEMLELPEGDETENQNEE